MRLWPSLIALLAVMLLGSQRLRAQEMCPEPMVPTIAALEECVVHAFTMGHIDNKGIANSLLAKLEAAQAALDRAQPEVAILLLGSFIKEVEAQAGHHIDAMHAAHMVAHAEMVIAELGG